MKKTRYLIISLFMLLISANAFSLSVFKEAEYSDQKADLYLYANVPSFLNYCKRYGISVDDISYLADDGIDNTGRNIIRNIAPGILDVLIAVNMEKVEKEKGYLLFVKEDGTLYRTLQLKSSLIDSQDKKLKLYRLDSDRDLIFFRKDNLTIIGDRDEVRSYIKNSGQGIRNESPYLKIARRDSVKKTFYLYVGFTGHLKKLFTKAMRKGKKFSSSLDYNVYLKSLYNLESVAVSAVFGRTAKIYTELRGGSDVDGERLMMFSHFIIVGSSFAIPLVEMFSRSYVKKRITADRKALVKVQEFFGRVRTRQIKKGVSISFDFTEDETHLIASSLKDAADKKRASVARKKHRKVLDDFFAAIRKGDIDKAEEGLNKLKDVNVLNRRETPLYHAAKNGSLESIRYLIGKGADVNLRSGPKSITPLAVAVKNNRLEAAALLIEKGSDLSIKDSRGYSLLHIAVEINSPAMARLLIDKKAGVNDTATGNITPLHIASENGNLEIVKILVEAGADRSVKDAMGASALDKASERKHSDVAEYLKTLD